MRWPLLVLLGALALGEEPAPPAPVATAPAADDDDQDDAAPAAGGVIAGATAAARLANYLAWVATSAPTDPKSPKAAMAVYAAHLLAGKDVDATLAAVRTMMEASLKGAIDPFNRHAVMHGFLVCPDRYPADVVAQFKAELRRQDYSKGIGVSLNYALMNDAAAFVAAEQWDDLVDRGGNDAAKIRALAKKRLLQTYAVTMRRGAQEYEAPLYYGTDIMPTRMLAEYARDPQVRQVAVTALAGMLVHLGAHWHQGYYITTSGRAKYWGSNNLSPDNPGATTAMAYLLFGGKRPSRLAHIPQSFWLAHPGTAVPTDWLEAWYRTLPTERVVRGSILRQDMGFQVRKQAWLTDGWGLASQRTDGTGPKSYLYKECRSVLLRWVSDKPNSSFVVFQDNRRRPHENIPNAFCYGENPWAQYLQDRGTVIAVYHVPEAYALSDLHVPFTTRGAIIARQEQGGWIACHGGSVLFGFRSLTPGRWEKPNRVSRREGVDLYQVTGLDGGWALETAAPAAYAATTGDDTPTGRLNRFAEALATKTRLEQVPDRPVPTLRFTNLVGRTLELAWKQPGDSLREECRIDGSPVTYDQLPLIETPGLYQPTDGVMTLGLPDNRLKIIDFQAWTITDKAGKLP